MPAPTPALGPMDVHAAFRAVTSLKRQTLDTARASRDAAVKNAVATLVSHPDALHAAKAGLDPATHFVAYLVVLQVQLSLATPASQGVSALLGDYVRLVERTPAEWVMPMAALWAMAGRHAASLAIKTRSVPSALALVEPLRIAADKSAPSREHIVPLQADFLAICIGAKCYALAARWIRSCRRSQVDPAATALTASDAYLLHHYSAVVFIGVKDFRAALQSCRLALAVPAPSPGTFYSVVADTYRKFVLVHLLVAGRAPSSLKFSSYMSVRLRKSASEYIELSEAYEKRDGVALEKIVESNRPVFEKDANLGLVKQVMEAFTRKLIIRLTTTFVTMRLEDVAARAGLASRDEAEAVLLQMIDTGRICASLDERDGVVRLFDHDALEDECNASIASPTLNFSADYMNQCLDMVKRIQAFRESLQCDPAYVSKDLSSRMIRRGGTSQNTAGFDTGSAWATPGTAAMALESEYL